MKKKVLIHLAPPKTATSFLQLNIFMPLHKENKINFLGRYLDPSFSEYYFPLQNIIHSVIFDNDTTFNNKKNALKKQLNNLLLENKLNVISEELISISYIEKHQDLHKKYTRLYELLSNYDVNILYSVRDYTSIIYSFYVEVSNRLFLKDISINTINKYLEKGLKEEKKGLFKMFYFHENIQFLSILFRTDNIFILNFHDLKKDSDNYYNIIESAMNNINFRNKFHPDKLKVNLKKKSKKGYFSEGINLYAYLKIKNPDLNFFEKKLFYLSNKYSLLKLLLQKIKIRSKLIPFFTISEKSSIIDTFKDDKKLLFQNHNINISSKKEKEND